jgi:hypothetical protein
MFAESFSRGLFTPGNYLLGLDFRVTALRCGHTGPGAVAERLKNLLRLHSLERVPASIASMLAQRSERLRRYCRSEQWLAPDVMIELVQQALES